MMARRRSLTAKERLRLFEFHGGCCYLCGGKIDGAREAWDVEHCVPIAMGGDDTDANMAPAHRKCHAPKTAEDMGNIAKAKRRETRYVGAKPPSRHVIPGSRRSRFKKKLDGTVVRREP